MQTEKLIVEAWGNDDNIPVHEDIDGAFLRGRLKTVGLNSNCDLDLIKDLIVTSERVLEIGCGFGRVIDYLIALNCCT